MQCIYCLQKDKKFNREHVIPVAFGSFKDAFVLQDLVCEDCNTTTFANGIDLVFARDSYEGLILRFQAGVKAEKEYKHMGKRSKSYARVLEGPFRGAYAYKAYSMKTGTIENYPAPQIGFRMKDGYYDFYRMEELPKADPVKLLTYDLQAPQAIMVLPFESGITERANKVLEEKGYKRIMEWRNAGEDEGRSISRAEYTWPIEETSFREVAKIAFNYLIYWQFVKYDIEVAREFALSHDFDDVRRYIVHGTKVAYPLVIFDRNTILKNANNAIVHVVTVDWTIDRRSIIAQVTILNQIRYRIILSRNFTGLWRDIRAGHVFCPHSNEIKEAIHTNLFLP